MPVANYWQPSPLHAAWISPAHAAPRDPLASSGYKKEKKDQGNSSLLESISRSVTLDKWGKQTAKWLKRRRKKISEVLPSYHWVASKATIENY